MTQTEESFEKWVQAYRRFHTDGSELRWPTESLVRMFKGDYIPGLSKDYAGKSILDIGFGNGNNLIFFASLGLTLYGTEVSQDICDLISQKFVHLEQPAVLRVGTNRHLPFDDDAFDFVVSWNVLHYEGQYDLVADALREYRRVLKRGGRVIVSTVGPENGVFHNGRNLGEGRYQIGRDDDFRKGQVFFCFETVDRIGDEFRNHFHDVLVGRVTETLFIGTNDTFLATGAK